MSGLPKALVDSELHTLVYHKSLSYGSTYLQPQMCGLTLLKPKEDPPLYMYLLWFVV
jgi:hypothetical protein